MEQITGDLYQKIARRGIEYCEKRKLADKQTFYLGLSMATIVSDPPFPHDMLYLLDHSTMRYYKVHIAFFRCIKVHMDALIDCKLYIREGFVDRSLNTEMYSPIDKFKYAIQDLEFTFEELGQIVEKFKAT